VPPERVPLVKAAPLSQRIAFARRLDLHDVGAEFREEPRAIRPRDERAELDHLEVRERRLHRAARAAPVRGCTKSSNFSTDSGGRLADQTSFQSGAYGTCPLCTLPIHNSAPHSSSCRKRRRGATPVKYSASARSDSPGPSITMQFGSGGRWRA